MMDIYTQKVFLKYNIESQFGKMFARNQMAVDMYVSIASFL